MSEEEKRESALKRFGRSAKEFLYGMAGHDMTRFALKTRRSRHDPLCPQDTR